MRFHRTFAPLYLLPVLIALTGCGSSNTNSSPTLTTPTPKSVNQWTWVSGSNTTNATGVYGTLGVGAASNVPGSRESVVSWTDSSGNLWLFGGGSIIGGMNMNDLWEFNPSSNEWTWISGSNTIGALGVYGTQGVPSSANVPAARMSAVSWIDSSDNLWLFGGNGEFGYMNDLWEFNPSTKEWTWVMGSNTAGASGVYGTLGVAAAGNIPGVRSSAVSWTDSSGNLLLFGGNGGFGDMNDLWEFNPSTKEWTWVKGSNTAGASGVYGTLGVAAPGNVPGARGSAVSWTDSSGNLWLFGGYSNESQADLNDLWEFNAATKEWTWVSGSNTPFAPGVYGTIGVAAAGNVPSARDSAISWTDSSGNLWLFGGYEDDSSVMWGYMNDLWKFNPSNKEWTWVNGSYGSGACGGYGTLGIAASGNVPGARGAAVSWIDRSGDLWLFSGGSQYSMYPPNEHNDLWKYQP